MINKEGINYDNWPLLFPFEYDLINIIQTVAQQNNMSED